LLTRANWKFQRAFSISYTATRKGYHLIIDDVPAWVCEQCGEPLFDEETVDTVQEMPRGVDVRVERLAVL